MTDFCLTFHFDGDSMWAAGFGLATPQYASRARFGREVAMPRILAFLREQEITATWFVGGSDAEQHADAVRRIIDDGHEIAHHGWAHEDVAALDEAAERTAIEQGLSTLERITGNRPRGYRSPSFDLSHQSIQLLQEYGFDWDSTLMGRDFAPYRPRVGDAVTDGSRFTFGQPAALVEIPISWALTDFYVMENVMTQTYMLPGSIETTALGKRWIDDYDFAAAEVPSAVFTPVFHPQTIGRGSKFDLLRTLVLHAREHGANFATVSEVAESWDGAHPLHHGGKAHS